MIAIRIHVFAVHVSMVPTHSPASVLLAGLVKLVTSILMTAHLIHANTVDLARISSTISIAIVLETATTALDAISILTSVPSLLMSASVALALICLGHIAVSALLATPELAVRMSSTAA